MILVNLFALLLINLVKENSERSLISEPDNREINLLLVFELWRPFQTFAFNVSNLGAGQLEKLCLGPTRTGQ